MGSGPIPVIMHSMSFCASPSVEQLRAKAGKTMVALCVAGHRKFLHKHWQ
jgi:hypothetical protein